VIQLLTLRDAHNPGTPGRASIILIKEVGQLVSPQSDLFFSVSANHVIFLIIIIY